MKNHFRADNSLYHGINYDPETGGIQHYQAGQGVSEKSAWARGQAWGLYGYTMMYRFTKDTRYLEQAVKIAEFILNHPNMPEDLVPYWDYNALDIPNTLRMLQQLLLVVPGYSSYVGMFRKIPDRNILKLPRKCYRNYLHPSIWQK